MVVRTKKTSKDSGIEVIADNNSTLLLNEKHIEEGLNHKNLAIVTKKYDLGYRKFGYELLDEPKK